MQKNNARLLRCRDDGLQTATAKGRLSEEIRWVRLKMRDLTLKVQAW